MSLNMADEIGDWLNSPGAAVIDKFLIIEQLTRYHHAIDFKQWDDLDAILDAVEVTGHRDTPRCDAGR